MTRKPKSLDQDPGTHCPACIGSGTEDSGSCTVCGGTGWRADLAERHAALSRPAVTIAFHGRATATGDDADGDAGIEALKAELKAVFDRLYEQLPGAEIHAHVTEVRVCRFCGSGQPESLDSDGSPLCCSEAQDRWWTGWARSLAE